MKPTILQLPLLLLHDSDINWYREAGGDDSWRPGFMSAHQRSIRICSLLYHMCKICYIKLICLKTNHQHVMFSAPNDHLEVYTLLGHMYLIILMVTDHNRRGGAEDMHLLAEEDEEESLWTIPAPPWPLIFCLGFISSSLIKQLCYHFIHWRAENDKQPPRPLPPPPVEPWQAYTTF